MCFNVGPLNQLKSTSAALTPALHAWPFERVSSLGLCYIHHAGRQIKGSIKTRANVAFICWGLSIKRPASLISLSGPACEPSSITRRVFCAVTADLYKLRLGNTEPARAVAELVLLSCQRDLTVGDGADFFFFFNYLIFIFIYLFIICCDFSQRKHFI